MNKEQRIIVALPKWKRIAKIVFNWYLSKSLSQNMRISKTMKLPIFLKNGSEMWLILLYKNAYCCAWTIFWVRSEFLKISISINNWALVLNVLNVEHVIVPHSFFLDSAILIDSAILQYESSCLRCKRSCLRSCLRWSVQI